MAVQEKGSFRLFSVAERAKTLPVNEGAHSVPEWPEASVNIGVQLMLVPNLDLVLDLLRLGRGAAALIWVPTSNRRM